MDINDINNVLGKIEAKLNGAYKQTYNLLLESDITNINEFLRNLLDEIRVVLIKVMNERDKLYTN